MHDVLFTQVLTDVHPGYKRETARLREQTGGELAAVSVPLCLYRLYDVKPEDKSDLIHLQWSSG